MATRLNNTGPWPALKLTATDADTPSLTVSNEAKVPRLNADKVDGLDSLALQRRIEGDCPAGQAISSVAANGDVACSSSAAGGAGELLLRHEEAGSVRLPGAALEPSFDDEVAVLTKNVTLSRPGFLHLMAYGRLTREEASLCKYEEEQDEPYGARLSVDIRTAGRSVAGAYLNGVHTGTAAGSGSTTAWLPAGEHTLRVVYTSAMCDNGGPTELTTGAVSASELKLTAVAY